MGGLIMNGLYLGEKAQNIISDIRNNDGYSYNALSRKAAIGNALCKLHVLHFDDEEERKAIEAVILTLSEYNELVTALSEEHA